MLKNYFEEIPLTEDIRALDYNFGSPIGMELYKRDDGMTYDRYIYDEYQRTIAPKVSFVAYETSEQSLSDLLNEIHLMRAVGCDPRNPPALSEIVPAIQEKLNTATTIKEYEEMAEAYGDWLYFLYRIKASFY